MMMDQAPQRYDASNAEWAASPAVNVLEVDTRQNPLQVLKIVVEALAVNASIGLWLEPYSDISMVPRISPFDLVYLNDTKRVVGLSAIRPGMGPNPPKGKVASALVFPLHTISLLRLDEGVLLNFSPIAPEDEEKDEATVDEAVDRRPENPNVAAAPEAFETDRAGRRQPVPGKPATQNIRTHSGRRPLTADELRIVETLKSYLAEPLAAFESGERLHAAELAAERPAESATPAAAEQELPLADEEIAQEPAEAGLPAAAEGYASSPRTDESLLAATRRRIRPNRMRRPKVSFSAKARSEPLQQGTAEEAAPDRPGEAKTAPTLEDSARLENARSAANLEGLAGQQAQQPTGGITAEPAEAPRSKRAEAAVPQPIHAETPRDEKKKEPAAKRASTPEPRSESKWVARISQALETNAERGLKRKDSAAKPATPATRRERPPASPGKDEAPKRRPAIVLPERQRLLIQPFHAMKTPAPPKPAPPGMLMRLLQHVYTGTRSLTNRRTALRKSVPGLVAFPWGRRNSSAYQVGNLSSTGLYLVSEERWPRGAVVSLALQRTGEREHRHAHRVLVEAGTIRLGEHGLGLVFVLPAPEDIRLWDELPDSPWFNAGPETVVREFRTARALTFLRRISPGGHEDFRNLLHKEFSFHRMSNAVDIVFMAEEVVASEPATFKYRAHPKLIREILTLGSWADAAAVQELWAGLLATGCTTEGHEVLNLTFAEILSQFTVVHAQLLRAICAGAVQAGETRRNEAPAETFSTIQKIMESTGMRNLLKIHHTIVQLCEFGLLEMQSGHSRAGEMPEFRANPTMLGLEFYIRCARIDSRFHLLQFK
ncbi:MAG: hypothetical protein WBD67_00035 [Terracidiphilus sp.]